MSVKVLFFNLLFVLIAFSISFIVDGALPDEWRSRTIYQLFTDRFSLGLQDTSPCNNLNDYCGGTFRGIEKQLDYIQGMGFDAIWISPIPENYPGGYHGYWMNNLENINSHFGTSLDLFSLVKECHRRNIFVMLDVVANHVGPVGDKYSSVFPFDKAEYYHDCSYCPSSCQIEDWNNQQQVEWCRLAGLPDLDQSNPFVQMTLNDWINDVVSNFSFDGLRIDTVPEVSKQFWNSYMKAAEVYAIGEVYNGNVDYVAGYQAPKGPLPGVLSYPLFFTLRDIFGNRNSMFSIRTMLDQYRNQMPDVGLLGTFIDNHDQPRFLHVQSDEMLYRNALLFILFAEGIPIVYYGTEQGLSGGSDPNNREALWMTGFNRSAPLYKFLSTAIGFRKKAQTWNYSHIERYVDTNIYVFTRGLTLIALTNGGMQQKAIQVSITYHPYQNGIMLCNILSTDPDCILVENNQFSIVLEYGTCKIYYPTNTQ